MTRREKIENIIIGTLLESTDEENYFDDCRSSLTEDMFLDETNRRIFSLVAEMNAKGKHRTDPCSIFEEYGEKVLDLCPVMADKMVEYSFIHLKTQYNEGQYIMEQSYGIEARYTNVQFVDYVRQLIILDSMNYEERNRSARGESAAA